MRRYSEPAYRELIGRDHELDVVKRLISGVRGRQSGVLVLRGPAGIGKTALLDHAVKRSRGFDVVRVSGVEAEQELAFAALHQLCAPLLETLDKLPSPQQTALKVVFGLCPGAPPAPLMVGLATLTLLARSAERRPLLCLIDDAQWLDRASAQAIAFLARRLLADPVVLLIATRESAAELHGLPELVLDRLGPADAGALLRSAVAWPVDDQVVLQLIAEAQGNPLAVLELARGQAGDRWAGGYGLPAALTPEDRVQEEFRRRLDQASEDARRLLLIAAADPTGQPSVIFGAAARLGIEETAASVAQATGLVRFAATVTFRHPLVRSAIYRAATDAEQRAAHLALAQATDANVDPDRHAWHLAAATTEPSEAVAAALSDSAARARARGGLAAAAAFLQRAAELTPAGPARSERTLAAAEMKHASGALEDALAALALVERDPIDELQRARASHLRARIAFASRRGSDAPPLLLASARALEAVDPERARTTYLEAFAAAMFAGRLAPPGTLADVAETVRSSPLPLDPAGPEDGLLHGLMTLCTSGLEAAAPILREALGVLHGTAPMSGHGTSWSWLPARLAGDLWDERAWAELSARELQSVRDVGALATLPVALSIRAFILAYRGELTAVESLADEMALAVEVTGLQIAPYPALVLAAVRGREHQFEDLVERTVRSATERGEGYALAVCEHLRALLLNGLGRFTEVSAAVIEREGEMGHAAGSSARATGELVEAAARRGDHLLAQRALERLTESTQTAGTDWALGVEARSRALVSEGALADQLYRESVDRLAGTALALELARSRLLYGEWLRRQRQRAAARQQLRDALDGFLTIGAEGFAARAERALVATGERARRRTVDTRDDLTAQERQIAKLAAAGRSNPEIATRLFLSPRTVEYHLGKVFGKLGIRTRGELITVFPPQDSEAD